jgi:hypothetical protein
MSGPLPAGEPRPKTGSLPGIFYQARTFLRWLDQQQTAAGTPIDSISQVTPADLERYQRYLLTTFRNRQYCQHLRSKVTYFWRYRQFLGTNALRFDPRTIDGWDGTLRHRDADNATDRIPEQVHSRQLAWALRFVDEFSGDIIAATQRWRQLRGPGRRSANTVGHFRNTGVADDIQAYLDAAIRENRPLPGHNGQPNGSPNLTGVRMPGCDTGMAGHPRPLRGSGCCT